MPYYNYLPSIFGRKVICAIGSYRDLEMDSESSTAQEVVEKVAEEEGTEPTELDAIFHTIDPEALDRLISSGEVSASFEYHGYQVDVASDGEVAVTPAETKILLP